MGKRERGGRCEIKKNGSNHFLTVGHYSISANDNLGGGKGGKAEGKEDAGGRDKQGLNYFSKTKKNR